MLWGKRKLKEDVRRTETLVELSLVILQCVYDEGGNERTVDRIIKDAKGSREFIAPFVREAIGPIWELAVKERPLNPVDLATPIDPGDRDVRVLPAVLNARWEPPQETMPFGNETYSLWHSYEALSPDDLEHLHFNNSRKVATLQELYWYIRGYEHWLGHCRIIAAGSRAHDKVYKPGGHQPLGQSSFPVAYVEDHNLSIDKTPVMSDGFERCFGPEYFYLIRNTCPDLKSYAQVHFGSCP